MSLSKLLRVLHRDLSYFFTGMILIYAVTGILLNHLKDINPYYVIDIRKVDLNLPKDTLQITKEIIVKELSTIGESGVKSFYYPQPNTLKIFVNDGTITANIDERSALIEKSIRRPILYQLNMMHKNRPHSWWTWFSDIFAIGLIIITITGLFLIKGKKGITGRGAILVIAGIVLPIVAMFVFF